MSDLPVSQSRQSISPQELVRYAGIPLRDGLSPRREIDLDVLTELPPQRVPLKPVRLSLPKRKVKRVRPFGSEADRLYRGESPADDKELLALADQLGFTLSVLDSRTYFEKIAAHPEFKYLPPLEVVAKGKLDSPAGRLFLHLTEGKIYPDYAFFYFLQTGQLEIYSLTKEQQDRLDELISLTPREKGILTALYQTEDTLTILHYDQHPLEAALLEARNEDLDRLPEIARRIGMIIPKFVLRTSLYDYFLTNLILYRLLYEENQRGEPSGETRERGEPSSKARELSIEPSRAASVIQPDYLPDAKILSLIGNIPYNHRLHLLDQAWKHLHRGGVKVEDIGRDLLIDEFFLSPQRPYLAYGSFEKHRLVSLQDLLERFSDRSIPLQVGEESPQGTREESAETYSTFALLRLRETLVYYLEKHPEDFLLVEELKMQIFRFLERKLEQSEDVKRLLKWLSKREAAKRTRGESEERVKRTRAESEESRAPERSEERAKRTRASSEERDALKEFFAQLQLAALYIRGWHGPGTNSSSRLTSFAREPLPLIAQLTLDHAQSIFRSFPADLQAILRDLNSCYVGLDDTVTFGAHKIIPSLDRGILCPYSMSDILYRSMEYYRQVI
jgi:hypothetical protein